MFLHSFLHITDWNCLSLETRYSGVQLYLIMRSILTFISFFLLSLFRRKSSCWRHRTSLEKSLIVALLIVVLFLLFVLLLLIYVSGKY